MTLIESLPTWLLSRAHGRAQTLLQEALAPADLRPLHVRALMTVAERGDVSQVELGQALGLDRKDVSQGVDLLAARGLVSRRPDPDDGRRNLVALTNDGRALVPELERTLARVQDDVLAPLDPSERDQLVKLLQKLRGVG